jgi:hypothetical protein
MPFGTAYIRQMANQVTVQLVNIDAPEIVKLFALTVEYCGTDDHGDNGAFGIEYVAVHIDLPGFGPRGKGCACCPAKARQITR